MIENKDLDQVVISAQPGYLVSNIEEGTFLWEPVVAWIVQPVLASSDDDVGSRPLIPITLTGTGPMRRSSGEREYIKHCLPVRLRAVRHDQKVHNFHGDEPARSGL